MARISIHEKNMKIKALRVAIILLKRESRIINFITVRMKANEIAYPKYFSSAISKGSVETSSDSEFKAIRKKIEKCKRENKASKKTIIINTKMKIKELEAKVDDLTFNIASLLENERELIELLASKEKALEKMRRERETYISRLRNENRL